MRTLLNNNAFSLVELLVAVAISVLLMTGLFGFFNASSQIYSSGISSQTLQDGANIVLSKIIEGGIEPGGAIYPLATSSSYYIPTGNPSVLYYCQDNPESNPCGPLDSTARWYSLDPTSTKILYYHPTADPLGYDVIYSAPLKSTLTLRFSPAAVATNPSGVVEIDVALNQNLPVGTTNNTVAANGSASTFVLLRNHP